MNNLSECDAAYLAGLVDADGTITVTRKHSNENRHPALSISNTDIDLLKFVSEKVGAGKITSKRVVHQNHTPSFAYVVYNRQALNLMTCMDALVSRRTWMSESDQADSAIPADLQSQTRRIDYSQLSSSYAT
jgi:hypothetical protein